MKFTLQLPITEINPPGEFQTGAAVREMAQALEAAGADALWVTDHPAPDVNWLIPNGHDALDPFTGLAFAAAATSKIQLQTNVLILPYRNPFLTAKAAATLDILSDGRLILAVGGGYQKGEFEALGVDFTKRGVLHDEALETIRLAWSGQTVVKQGRGFDAKGNLPRPAPRADLPIWIGGGSDKAIERAVKWGDGWCPFYSKGVARIDTTVQKPIDSLKALRSKVDALHEMRAKAGKSGPFDVCMNPIVNIAAQTRAEADRFLEHMKTLEAAGVTWVFTGVAHQSRAAFLENVQWFGEEVIARQ